MAKKIAPVPDGYDSALAEIVELLQSSRRAAARAINTVITTTYFEIGRRIVELEQGGKERAPYGLGLLGRLAQDREGKRVAVRIAALQSDVDGRILVCRHIRVRGCWRLVGLLNCHYTAIGCDRDRITGGR